MIESEEDAERALRLSSALTQKLLAYRFKTVSSVSYYYYNHVYSEELTRYCSLAVGGFF